MDRLILNRIGKKHEYSKLTQIFQDLSEDDKSELSAFLGVVNESTPRYSLDIVSSEATYLTTRNVTLEAKLYNYLSEITPNAVLWDRYIDGIQSDWSKSGRVLNLTSADFPTEIGGKKVTFKATAFIGQSTLTDIVMFTEIPVAKMVHIESSYTTFINASPGTIELSCSLRNITAQSYRWYVDNVYKGATAKYTLNNAAVPLGGLVQVRLEVVSSDGTVYTDTLTMPKVANGLPGDKGVPGVSTNTTVPSYMWVRYAEDNSGTNMVSQPTDKTPYIGIAYNQTSEAPSTNPAAYTWSLFKGSDGAPGSSGATVRVLEWVDNKAYYNNTVFKDYVYHRATNKYYKLNNNVPSYVATGSPISQPTIWIETTDVQTSVIAEGANIGGFIMKNNKFYSQAGLKVLADGSISSNIVLDGANGKINLDGDSLEFNKNGITMSDDNKIPRIIFGKDPTGTPILRFLNTDGTVSWEAGKNGYQVIVTGTTQPSWTTDSVRLISSLSAVENLDFTGTLNNNRDMAKSFIQGFLAPTANAYVASSLPENKGAYFILNTFDTSRNYNESSFTSGKVYLYNKGDISSNKDFYEAYYTSQTKVAVTQLPNDNVLADGWYMISSYTGSNGAGLMANIDYDNNMFYIAPIVYMKTGIVTKVVDISVHEYRG